MLNAIRQFVKEEEGASAAEYALLMAIVAVAVTTAVVALRDNIVTAITTAANNVATANGNGS